MTRVRRVVWGLLALTPLMAQPRTPIDLTNFVVVGEGLAAGFANFSLQRVYQEKSFPTVMAKQMGVQNFPQPLIQAPGLGSVAGFPVLPARVPGWLQDTVRVPGGPKPTDRLNAQPPFALFFFNVSIPGMKVADALTRKPALPMMQTYDPQQTLINMTLGFPLMITGENKPVWTQVEYGRQMNASFGLLALGYYDFVDAAAKGDAGQLPDVAAFRSNFSAVLNGIRNPAVPLVVANVPDPLDSAYVSTLDAAGRLLSADPSDLRGTFKLNADDLITIPGLIAMGNQILTGNYTTLPAGSVVSGAFAAAERSRVKAVNTEIANLAQAASAPICDLNAVFARARAAGVVAGGRTLTADFQGGIFSLSGFYPGATLQAVMANECLSTINKAYGTVYSAVDLDAVAADDPMTRLIPMRRGPARSEVQ